MKIFGLWRAGERKADVVELSSGKCVVAWPTSVIVYDSLDAAKSVHIVHMGGRGEPTEFRPDPRLCTCPVGCIGTSLNCAMHEAARRALEE